MAMNSSFFYFFLYFILSTGWCFIEGSCPEETCFSSNRETCEFGSNECGECFQGFFEVGKNCIPIESDQNNDDYENDLEGTDGSDLEKIIEQTTRTIPTERPTKDEKLRTLLFSPTSSSDLIPSSAPATGVDEEENESSNKNNDLETKVAAKNAEELSKPKGKSHKLTTGIANVKAAKNINKKSDSIKNIEKIEESNHGNTPSKRKETIKENWNDEKRRDETKLNNFLSKTEKKENEDVDGKILSSPVHMEMNLEANSSKNPPPFISKHKVGKTEEARTSELDDIYFLFIVIGCSVAGIAGLALAGYCWYKLHTTAKAVSEAEYSAYGTKMKRPPLANGDEKLDYSAEMYHYHQTKSQLAAMEKASGSRSSKQGSLEDEENSDEGDEGDYTVYECPGLAPTGDMTVVNPLFSDQEVIASDQDANGNHSGHSSPGTSRHSSTTKPE